MLTSGLLLFLIQIKFELPEIMCMRLMNKREWDNLSGIGVPEIMSMRLMNKGE